MAVFTELTSADARRLAQAHHLGELRGVVPIPAGSVNSNFFLETAGGRYFARIYEEQEADGVAYEWALLDHLRAAGLPVPERIPGPAPGELRVAAKPTAVFALVHGRESCQRAVTPARAAAVGCLLARCHLACRDFGWRRAGRFGLRDVRARLEGIGDACPAPVRPARTRLLEVLDEVEQAWPLLQVPRGVIHGDLFRDNVRWDGDAITALIDWESASDGLLVFDLMVCVLAWCYGAAFDWSLARALVEGYGAERPLSHEETRSLRTVGMAAAARFATTRITDFELREGAIGERTHKDYRRFMARLEVLASMAPDELAERLGATSFP
ncbi:MAG: homoserine kinase [Myxococcota bacterium]